eukprot:6209148-Pleurochrysis_carterae.AAC.2
MLPASACCFVSPTAPLSWQKARTHASLQQRPVSFPASPAPYRNPPENRELTAEIMFETFNVKGLYIAVQAVLALCASWTSKQAPSRPQLNVHVDYFRLPVAYWPGCGSADSCEALAPVSCR